MRVWKVLKQLSALSSSILSIIFYSGSQNFVDAFFTVYLYFYAALAPLLIVSDIYKLIKAPRRLTARRYLLRRTTNVSTWRKTTKGLKNARFQRVKL